MRRLRTLAAVGALLLAACAPALAAGALEPAAGALVVKRELIRESARISDLGQQAAREALARAFVAPVSESDVVAALSRAMIENGSSEYVDGFEAIVASGPASAIPHGDPLDDATNLILPGEVVVVDIGARYMGWVSDNTKTYFIGASPPQAFLDVYAVVEQAQRLAVGAVRSGAQAREVDAVARQFIDQRGYGDLFLHCLGHGVGLYVHVPPMLCADSDDVLLTARNDVVAVEPGIYLDGCFGVRIEDDFAVLRDGAERYTFAPSALADILLPPPPQWNGSSPSGAFADYSGCAFDVDAKAAAGAPGGARQQAASAGQGATALAAAAAAAAGAVLFWRWRPHGVGTLAAGHLARPAAALRRLARR